MAIPSTPHGFTGSCASCGGAKFIAWRPAYAVAGWLIIQFAVAVFPVLSLPEWTTRLVVFLVLGGFPIALILGWAFDLGPGGIQVTPEPVAD